MNSDESDGSDQDLASALTEARVEAAKAKSAKNAAQRKGRAERHARQRAEEIARLAEARATQMQESLTAIERRGKDHVKKLNC